MSCQKKSKSSHSKLQVNKSKTRKFRGGSPASDLVNAAANGKPVKNDYVSDPRVREGPNADYIGMSTRSQLGGSAAYDMTMENLTNSSKTNKYADGWKVKGDMKSLKTYNPSGGKRNNKHKSNKHKSNKHKSNKSKSNKRNRKYKRSNRNTNNNNNTNHNRVVSGGASDYMSSYYSLDSNVARPNIAWDPPTRDIAGSGAAMSSNEGANVYRVGAPLV